MSGDEELRKKILSTFQVEAGEHLEVISATLLDLEKDLSLEEKREKIEDVYRRAHSLKGASRAVNLLQVEDLCRALEGAFSRWKEVLGEDDEIDQKVFDLFHESLDLLERMIESEFEGEKQSFGAELMRRKEELYQIAQGNPPLWSKESKGEEEGVVKGEKAQRDSSGSKPGRETIRVSHLKLDALLASSEELLEIKLFLEDHLKSLKKLEKLFARELKRSSKPFGREETKRGFGGKIKGMVQSFQEKKYQIESQLEGLLKEAREVVMLPFSSLLQGLGPMVRNLSRSRQKEVELITSGGEVEMDKRILEGLRDPLIHLIRNALDHGIESPEEREKKGKPRQGKIEISLHQLAGNEVEIRLCDDGRGLAEDLIQKKIKSGGRKREWREVIFESGFSTSPMVTDLSGRGLGLAIVRDEVNRLRGKVEVETEKGVGTTVNLTLPSNLVTFRGIFAEIKGRKFVFPTRKVEAVIQLEKRALENEKGHLSVPWEDQIVPLVCLGEILELSGPFTSAGAALILEDHRERVAFYVDSVFGESEILAKSLGPQLKRVRNISRVTVLASGEIVPILNTSDLMDSFRKGMGQEVASIEKEEKPIRILLAEDSFTSRILLENILTGAGYEVETAEDGRRALELLQGESFDAVVTDIEMPYLDGFELTQKIRQKDQWRDLPVVLVTSLDSPEDRQRGLEVGADAYIVKSSFDQSNLLDVLMRMV